MNITDLRLVACMKLMALATGLCCSALGSSAAAELHVCHSGCGYDSLQGAVDVARSGDTIKIGAGTYVENVLIDKSLTLQGKSEDSTTIDGGLAGPVFRIGTLGKMNGRPVIISGMTITHGRGVTGGGIYSVDTQLQMTYVILTSNYATITGGGVYVDQETAPHLAVTIGHCVFSHNRAPYGGGISTGSKLTVNIMLSSITRNTADTYGGGLLVADETVVNLSGSTVSDNSSSAFGGGLFLYDGTPGAAVIVTRSAIVNNNATQAGGGYFAAAGLHGSHLIIADGSVIALNSPAP